VRPHEVKTAKALQRQRRRMHWKKRSSWTVGKLRHCRRTVVVVIKRDYRLWPSPWYGCSRGSSKYNTIALPTNNVLFNKPGDATVFLLYCNVR
jgi:hypothetical protein